MDCPCQQNCPLGCPCPIYDCDIPEKKAILVLNSYERNEPVLINPSGGVNEQMEFKMGEETSSYYSCSAKLNGEFYVFGGKGRQSTQMSKVIGCELTRLGDLAFEFDGGACGTFKFPEERIMLCFAYTGSRKCVSYDGTSAKAHASTTYSHYTTSLADFEGSPLAVGGWNEPNNRTEIFNIANNKWTESADYPYHQVIRLFSTVSTEAGALIMGGVSDKELASYAVSTVACYNQSGWSKVGDLHSNRYNHRAMINGQKIFVVGGSGEMFTEIWQQDETSFGSSVTLADPVLASYYRYPELLLVDINFCQ